MPGIVRRNAMKNARPHGLARKAGYQPLGVMNRNHRQPELQSSVFFDHIK
ncbi:MAG TPA: hypothetical protein PK018_05810 [Candidatus Competibacter sp.]|nr:hypothetical protein [Candidatus Competibacteraceae bacterium]HPE71675.1 hypothetical protein [Candidatus Competibacter sp.]